MIYRLLADLLVVGHITFILFVVAGGLLVLRRPRLAFLHLPLAAWGAFVEFSGLICPLTPWEVRFRRLGGEAGTLGGSWSTTSSRSSTPRDWTGRSRSGLASWRWL